MKRSIVLIAVVLAAFSSYGQQPLFVPENIKLAYTLETRSADGNPGKKYWQNEGRYNINVTLNPPDKTIRGTETITYINHKPTPLTRLIIKLILNTHKAGAARLNSVSENYLSTGVQIDKYTENGIEKNLESAGGETWQDVPLTKRLNTGDSVQITFDWHYNVSDQSGREGKLDNTSFFLAYFYPRVAVMDDTHGWDRMGFLESQEFYNDFNDYQVSVNVPKNFLVWGTGDLLNAGEVLQKPYLEKYQKSLTSDEVITIASLNELTAKKVTTQNKMNTWRFAARHITDMAFCISDHYVWDAASVVVDKATGRRASCQAAYIDTAVNFHHTVQDIRHSLDWYSNNWPGVAYPFPKSTIIQGLADMEYPMMANDSPQDDPVFQTFVAEHEVGHSYYPFYMGINEHRYGFMDEGWTTAFEYLIGISDMGKDKASEFFKQFRVGGWALNPSDETQVPIITPANILSGQALGHNEYGKPALAYLGLKDMLGDEVFRKCLHGFMQRWNGKHPLPWDMFNSYSNLAGKDLNWYWNNWFFTPGFIDVKADALIASKTGYTLSVKNTGGFVIPLDVQIEYADNSTDTLHYTASIWEKNQQVATIELATAKKISYLKIDGGIFMDANENDNSWGSSKRKEAALSNGDLNKYAGTYGSPQLPIKILFSVEGNKLIAEATGQGAITMKETGKDTFVFDAAGLTIIFDTDKGEMTLKQAGGAFVFKKEK